MQHEVAITVLDSADVSFVDGEWNFADRHAADIAVHWTLRVSQKPKLFNGPVLMLQRWSINNRQFVGQCIRTDFKSFLYWREHDAPDRSVADFFPAAAIHTNEGWLVLIRSGLAMSNAGKVYPPCGSLDVNDRFGNNIDFDLSIIREVREEIGIELDRAKFGPLLLAEAPPQIVLMRPVRLPLSANEILERGNAHIRSTGTGEIDSIFIVKGQGDVTGDLPPFTLAYIDHAFGYLGRTKATIDETE